jgi:hypothetical protein
MPLNLVIVVFHKTLLTYSNYADNISCIPLLTRQNDRVQVFQKTLRRLKPLTSSIVCYILRNCGLALGSEREALQ